VYGVDESLRVLASTSELSCNHWEISCYFGLATLIMHLEEYLADQGTSDKVVKTLVYGARAAKIGDLDRLLEWGRAIKADWLNRNSLHTLTNPEEAQLEDQVKSIIQILELQKENQQNLQTFCFQMSRSMSSLSATVLQLSRDLQGLNSKIDKLLGQKRNYSCIESDHSLESTEEQTVVDEDPLLISWM
jgi:hypothetical protein